MRKAPVLGPVSVARNDSESPASADATVMSWVSMRSGSRLHCDASKVTKNGWPALNAVAGWVLAASLNRRSVGGCSGTTKRTGLASVPCGWACRPSMNSS